MKQDTPAIQLPHCFPSRMVLYQCTEDDNQRCLRMST